MTAAKPREFEPIVAPEGVFSKPPAAFVDTWASALGLDEDELTGADRDGLVLAIRNGTNRLQVIDALERRRAGSEGLLRAPSSHGVRRAPDCFALIDVFARFAPDDDAAFLRYAFERICHRGPGDGERLELEFDLRRGLLDRTAAVKRVVAIACGEGHGALWDDLAPHPEAAGIAPADATSARAMPAGLVYDENGRQTLIFVREVPGTGIVSAPDVLRQSPRLVDTGWMVHEGWLVTGPKRSFAPGRWRVDVDLLQPADAVVDLDIVANSGLDVLQQIAICGSFTGSFCVEFRPEHRFSELRLAVRPWSQPERWIRLRNVSLQRLS